MDLIFWIFVLICSIVILSKSANKFTQYAEKIGLWLRFSPFIVGVTIVAMGTSLPELISSIIAVLGGNSEIVIGNVIGSNVTNILLILGLSALVAKKIRIKESFLRIDLMVFITSVFMLVLVTLNGTITLPESLILVACFFVYIFYIIKTKKPEDKGVKPIDLKRETIKLKDYAQFSMSIFFLLIAAKFTIDSIVEISLILNIGKEIIAATVVAFGTSLPELVVSLNAIKKGKSEMAIGNVLGSNIFNIFAVTGIAGLFGTLIVPKQIILIGSLFMILSTLLYYFSVKDKMLSIWDGMFLLLLYLLFIVQITGWA